MDERITAGKATKVPSGTPIVLATGAAIRTEALHFTTGGSVEFWDLTDMVRDVVKRSMVRHGQVTVFAPHTTTSIVINESETGFLNDFRRLIDAIAPKDGYFEHDDHELRTENLQEDEFLNGHAHVRQLLVGQPSVLFVELDQARERRVFIHAQGA
jgi:secondary thiamine-phosphate synthase enzyme